MILTTTQYIEGRHILEYKGIVLKKERLEYGLFSPGDEEYKQAYYRAANDLKQQAADMGANAVVGMQINCITYKDSLSLSVAGTAVLVD